MQANSEKNEGINTLLSAANPMIGMLIVILHFISNKAVSGPLTFPNSMHFVNLDTNLKLKYVLCSWIIAVFFFEKVYEVKDIIGTGRFR